MATDRLCVTCTLLTGVCGAGITLMPDDVAHGSSCTSNPTSALIEEAQYTLGEGPCVDAHRRGRPVPEPDLAGVGTSRQAAFTEAVVAAWVILLIQARAPAGTLADELARSAELHVVVHQAAGMVAVQLGIGVADALVRLRAHAFATGTPLHKLAEDVVDRRLRFDTPDGLREER